MLDISKYIWNMKYRYKNEATIEDTWKRLAKGCSVNEKNKEEWEKKFYDIIEDFKFLPAGRIYANLGTDRAKATLMNCYVMGPIEDSIEGIFDNIKEAAVTLKSGGGTGFNFSTVRPKGAWIKGVEAESSGPISFMKVYNSTCQTIISAGNRRGAILSCLRCDHPDIEEFITVKQQPNTLEMMNLSVGITDKFMEAVDKGLDWDLVFEGKVYKTIKAKDLWERIMESTYTYAEPGFLNLDAINKWNNLSYCETITTTNPCVVGDTKIAVADGRKSVTIKELADMKKDVPVYCVDDKGALKIRMMRRPRLTGHKEVYEVLFDDGSKERFTGNHELILKNNTLKQVQDLQKGDSLQLHTKTYDSLSKPFKEENEERDTLITTLVYKMIRLIQKKKKPLYKKDWIKYAKEHDLPTKVPFRNISNFIQLANIYCRYSFPDPTCITSKFSTFFRLLQDTDLHLKYIDGDIYVQRECEVCGNIITQEWEKREVSNCSECSPEDVFQKYEKVSKDPIKTTIQKEGKSIQVVSVTKVARVFVYNGTVDEFHNYGIVLNEKQSEDKSRLDLIFSKNCGEQTLGPYESCNLGSLNLTHFVHNSFSKESSFNFGELARTTSTAVRFLDNIIDISNFPLQVQKDTSKSKRRVGLGITGLADTMVMLGLRYGYEHSVSFTENVMRTITEVAYSTSINLAKEKGSFPMLDKEKYVSGPFVQQLPKKIQEDILKFGIRNSHLTTVAPSGTISMLAGNVSSGIEPIFQLEYRRKVKQKGDETDTLTIKDYAYHVKPDDILDERFITSDDILPMEHVNIQAVAQKWVDSSISKTVSVPTEFPFKDFKDVYKYAYMKGCKGITTFRSNIHKQGILGNDCEECREADRREDVLECDIHRSTINGNNWIVLVGLQEDVPYELFGGKREKIEIPNKYKKGWLKKRKDSEGTHYDLFLGDLETPDIVIHDVPKRFTRAIGEYTRLISLPLRHKISLKHIKEQLLAESKDKELHLYCFERCISRILGKYIKDGEKVSGELCPDCNSPLIYRDGCKACSKCFWSKCN